MEHHSTAPYGPATPAIRRFLQRFASLGDAQRAQIVAKYIDASSTPAFVRAERALADTIARSDRTAMQAALSGPLLQLVRTSRPDGEAESSNAAPGDADTELDAIGEPALAAVLALMMRDVLQMQDFETLYASFTEFIAIDSLID